jgi:tripartite-type tricarboxylate transporter receptor subunit TctC
MSPPLMFRRLRAAAAGLIALAAATVAAQEFPTRPMTFIVPFAPGGSLDPLTRFIGDGIAKELGQPVVMDFRPGQGGYTGADLLGKARADGYTFGMIASTHAVGHSVYPKLTVNILEDLTHVGLFLKSPFVLVAHNGFDAKTLDDVVRLAKARPGQINFASSGNGSSAHLLGEMLKRAAGIDMVHVPYKAGSNATIDVIAGHVSLYFELATLAVNNANAGKVRAIAVSGETRLPALPNVPTTREAGFPAVALTGWGGVSVPKGAPPAAVQRLSAALQKVVAAPETRARFAQGNAEAVPSTAEAFNAWVRAETERLGAIVREAKIKPD